MINTFWQFWEPKDSHITLVSMGGQFDLTLQPGIHPTGREGQYAIIPAGTTDGWGATLTVSHSSKQTQVHNGVLWLKGDNTGLQVDTGVLANSFPINPPSRLEVLQVNMHFRGGLTCDSSTYGKMCIWPSALSMLDKVTRFLWYDEFRKAGDTHCIIHIQSGPVVRGNFYYANPDKFSSFDWTYGLTAMDPILSQLVDEVINQGFKFIITMNETESISLATLPLAVKALTREQMKYGFFMPGYDGVFYGWPNDQTSIPQWGAIGRSLNPDIYLGLEHDFGHIPLGEDGQGGDYKPGGKMKDFDVILGEFPTCSPRPTFNLDAPPNESADSIWQVLGRMIRPYNRPPEQPAHDDPNPPFLLEDSVRGPRVYVAFETWEPYWWVRIDPYDPNAVGAQMQLIQRERDYLKELGCKFIG